MVVECQYSGEMKDLELSRPFAIACYQKWDREHKETSEETLCKKWNYPGTQLPQLQLPEHLKSPHSNILLYKTTNLESFNGETSQSQDADASGWFKNEYERTGFSGKGKLPQYGANLAAYLLITIHTYGTTKVLVEDTDDYTALPRFWLKRGTIDEDYIKRKLLKLNLYCKESEISEMAKGGQQYYTGYLKNKENTDNAWVDGAVVHVHDPTGECFGPYPVHADVKSRKYRWQILPDTTTARDFAQTFAANYK
ncbi:hypothetical protein TTRE_0000921901 [Trichuris trichiura]|uniref:Uncharacterized protein n=1 Tax=Trichuris trichiura TaxID=36087 RepID=A0A077ZPZ2_TRITR|nr:hypothetical protein TTRE_0000921901 [Trichuris trichiura]